MSRLFVVRHGERLDEVPNNTWEEECASKYPHSLQYFRVNDPPLTSSGIQQAREVAQTLAQHLGDRKLDCIYCSKLLRAVQTAYEIARHLAIPMVLSEGLAKTAAAVEKVSAYQFLSLSEIATICPGVRLIDGDAHVSERVASVSGTVHDASTSLSDRNSWLLEVLPKSHWYQPLAHIASKSEVSIVVAHRETIRNIAQIGVFIPYCGFGIFHYEWDKGYDSLGSTTSSDISSVSSTLFAEDEGHNSNSSAPTASAAAGALMAIAGPPRPHEQKPFAYQLHERNGAVIIQRTRCGDKNEARKQRLMCGNS